MHDRMTEEVYAEPLRSFRSAARPAAVYTIPVLERGRAALEEINAELGLAFDEQARPLFRCSTDAGACAQALHSTADCVLAVERSCFASTRAAAENCSCQRSCVCLRWPAEIA